MLRTRELGRLHAAPVITHAHLARLHGNFRIHNDYLVTDVMQCWRL